MSAMNFPGEPGSNGDTSQARTPNRVPDPDRWATFTPMAFDGLAWARITGPQQDARAACLLATAHIHLFRPEVPLRDLDAKAETAIRALEEGALTVLVIDDRHRVDRTSPAPVGRDEPSSGTS
jgi:hypothetical protein